MFMKPARTHSSCCSNLVALHHRCWLVEGLVGHRMAYGRILLLLLLVAVVLSRRDRRSGNSFRTRQNRHTSVESVNFKGAFSAPFLAFIEFWPRPSAVTPSDIERITVGQAVDEYCSLPKRQRLHPPPHRRHAYLRPLPDWTFWAEGILRAHTKSYPQFEVSVGCFSQSRARIRYLDMVPRV